MSYTIKKSPGQHVFQHINYIQIEPHTGCTRKCEFCGIMHENKHLDMSLEIFQKILEGVTNKTKRISFSLGGEPFMNPILPDLFNYTRSQLPKIQISTVSNGDMFTKVYKSLNVLWESFRKGLNIIQIDLYDAESYEKFKELLIQDKHVIEELGIQFVNYHRGGFNPWSYHGSKNRTIIYCDEREGFNKYNTGTRNFHTWAGNLDIDYLKEMGVDLRTDFPVDKVCTEPLNYIAFEANGDQMLCCSNGPKVSNLGSIKEHTIMELWKGETFQKYRYALKHGRRDLIPDCYLCNKRSFRHGLYPYWGEHEYDFKELEVFFSSKEHSNIRSILKENLIKIKDTIKNPSLRQRIEELDK